MFDKRKIGQSASKILNNVVIHDMDKVQRLVERRRDNLINYFEMGGCCKYLNIFVT